MRQELDQLLCERYPKIFANRHADMKTTAMCWGFEHDDGWFNIIDQLCANIQHHIDWREKQRQWTITFNSKAAPEELKDIPEVVSQVIADQVKEKFGALRFYYHGGDDIVDGMARMAEYEMQGNIAFESVDQIVTGQLSNIESDKFNKNLLLDIYRNL